MRCCRNLHLGRIRDDVACVAMMMNADDDDLHALIALCEIFRTNNGLSLFSSGRPASPMERNWIVALCENCRVALFDAGV